MKFTSLLFSASLASAGVARHNGKPKALYFLDNDPNGANIVALSVGQDGELSNPVKTSTGGKGLSALSVNNTILPVDQLNSQDAVVVSGTNLFTVNAGSNTVSFFDIPRHDPLHPVLVGQPAYSGGEFPSTVAYSKDLDLACVMNTGAKAGVMCYHPTRRGLQPVGEFMSLPVNETTPPTGPPRMASDIVFNPSSTALFVTVKGDGQTPGFVAGFPVKHGKVLNKVVISRPAELLIDFSISFLDDNYAIITDPAYGASKVEIAYPSLEVRVVKKTTIVGQAATCWSRYSRQLDTVFVFDAGVSNITTLDPATGDVKYTIPVPATTQGSFDSIIAGKWLYVLEAASGIAKISLQGASRGQQIPSFVSSFDLSAVGNRATFQGLASWPSSY